MLVPAVPSLRQTLADHLRRHWVWPAPDAGWAWWVFASRQQNAPWLPADFLESAVATLREQTHFDHAPILAATGFVAEIGSLPRDVADKWRAGFDRIQRRDAFPLDRQTFPFRATELLGIALGAAHLASETQKAWLREVLERLQNLGQPFDFWRWTLGALASAAIEVVWSVPPPSLTGAPEQSALALWLCKASPTSAAFALAQKLEAAQLDAEIESLRHTMFAPLPTLETNGEMVHHALLLWALEELNQPLAPLMQKSSLIRYSQQNLHGKIDVAIISIREDEFKAILRRFPQEYLYQGENGLYSIHSQQADDGRTYAIAAVRAPEQGQTAAQHVTHHLIADLAPRYLMLVGIGGAVPANEFTLGDVVVATRLQDFSLNAHIEGGKIEYGVTGGPMHPEIQKLLALLPAYTKNLGDWNTPTSLKKAVPPVIIEDQNFYGSLEWQKTVRASLDRHWNQSNSPRQPKVTTGSVASSNSLIKDTEVIAAWKQSSRQVTAVEMELGGVYQAAQTSREIYPIIAIRGISDIVGFKRHHDWTEYACETAASFAHALIRTGLLDCLPKTQFQEFASPQSPSQQSPASDLTHSTASPLSHEAQKLLTQLQTAQQSAPAETFRFYDVRPVAIRHPQLKNEPTNHSNGCGEGNLTTHFNAKGMARVSVPTAAYLSALADFSIPQSDEASRVKAFDDSMDDFSAFCEQMNNFTVEALVLHPGLPQGGLAVRLAEIEELVEEKMGHKEGVTNFRLSRPKK